MVLANLYPTKFVVFLKSTEAKFKILKLVKPLVGASIVIDF